MKTRPERKRFVAFYVSDKEKDMIVGAATTLDMSISDYCRKILVKQSEKDAGEDVRKDT